MGRHDEWVARDAAVVWHGFTQMDAFAENAPVLVERGEGHELIDVDGRRYLDAISSLWVNTLGHAVPELDDAVRFPVLRAPQFGDPGCFDTAVAMVAAHAHELAAVIVEPLVQGAAGMLLADPDGLRALGRACDEHDVLLICDEVATGFGRTGSLFASEQCGLRPDLLVLGKGLTGGYLPMSATAARRRVYDAFLGPDLSERTFYHGHSYSGN